MTILSQTDPVPAEVFGREIRRLSPGTAIVDDPAKADPASVEAILAWKLNDGIAGKLPNLRLVCSMASGVDKILPAKDLAPHLPVVRIVDAAQALAMAQYVVVMALRHVRGLVTFEAQQRARAPTPSVNRCAPVQPIDPRQGGRAGALIRSPLARRAPLGAARTAGPCVLPTRA